MSIKWFYKVTFLFSKHQQNICTQIINKKADLDELKNSLLNLCNYLYKATAKKTYILIDEYDTPLHAAYRTYLDEMASFSIVHGMACSLLVSAHNSPYNHQNQWHQQDIVER